MPERYFKATGLDSGQKRSLEWFGNEPLGDPDLVERFAKALQTVRETSAEDIGEPALVETALRSLFDELLDFEKTWFQTPAELDETVRRHNSNSASTPVTALELDRRQREDHFRQHFGPPYEWEEIEECLAPGRRAPRGKLKPEFRPKCLVCLCPMDWIYFRSSPETWELECGRAGWTPICRQCKTWRACEVTMMS